MNLNISTQSLGVLSFGIAALACWLVRRRGGGLWGSVAAVYLALAVEVVLPMRIELSSLLREALRASAIYDERTGLPAVLILGLMLFLLVLGARRVLRRPDAGPARLALLSCLGALCLFGLEIASLHSLDALLYRPAGPVFLVGWVWAGMSALAVLAALLAWHGGASNRPPSSPS